MRIACALLAAALVLGCGARLPGASGGARPSAALLTTPPATRQVTAEPGRPPEGLLSAGAAAVSGWLGTYCWDGTCVDTPVTPGASELPSLRGAAAELSFELGDGSFFGAWSSSYSRDPRADRIVLGEGGSFDPDASPQSALAGGAMFLAPPPGDWVVIVNIVGPAGDAVYAWHVIVE